MAGKSHKAIKASIDKQSHPARNSGPGKSTSNPPDAMKPATNQPGCGLGKS